jgi:transcriptional regulator with XRE-family HTH domain
MRLPAAHRSSEPRTRSRVSVSGRQARSPTMAGMGYIVERLDPLSEEALREFGNVLRALRAQRGLSQRALAARSGLSQSTICRLETGIARGVRIRVLARMLAGLERGLEHQLDKPWIVAAPPGWALLIETFAPHGRFAKRVARGQANQGAQNRAVDAPTDITGRRRPPTSSSAEGVRTERPSE